MSRHTLNYTPLLLTATLMELPVTDLRQALKEINLHRRALAALEHRLAYNREVTRRWQARQATQNPPG